MNQAVTGSIDLQKFILQNKYCLIIYILFAMGFWGLIDVNQFSTKLIKFETSCLARSLTRRSE